MGNLSTKFQIGDTVYKVTTTEVCKSHPCPDCLGEGKWKATSPAGTDYTFTCPRCSTSYQSHDAMCLKYYERAPRVDRLTIGSIRVDTHDDKPVSYMCHQTGVGSGTIHYESDLFADEQEAQTVATLRASKETAETERLVTRYNRTLALSDYQLENAVTLDLQAARFKFECAAENLVDDLDSAETHGDVRALVDTFKKAISHE